MEEEQRIDKKVKENKKNNKSKIIFVIILLVIAIIFCTCFYIMKNKNVEVQKQNSKSVKVKDVYADYRISENSLNNFDLYFLQLENKNENKIYSPLSIKYALEMLAEGASGNTKSQIVNIIGNYTAKKYINSPHMSFANAMFIRNSYINSIKSDYINTLSSKYNAEIIYDEFNNANNMNSWVSNKTFNLVNNLFDDNKVRDENFILTNALAIDMNWNNLIQCASTGRTDISCMRYYVKYKHENYSEYIDYITDEKYSSLNFNNTKNSKAVEIGASINNYDIINTLGEENIRKTVGDEYQEYLDNGGESCGYDVDAYLNKYISELDSNYKQVDASTDFYLYNDEEVKAFAKDLKEYDGTTLQYVGIMPKNDSLDSYVKDIKITRVNDIINNLKAIELNNFKSGVVTKVTGYIPLFKFDYTLNLMNDLQQLGITDVFDINKADLSGMLSDEKAYINDVSHKANIEFSNEGIKAAAATQAGGGGSAGCGTFEHKYDVPVETIDLTFDKPYLFLIRDKDTGEVWFVGTVYEPIEN